MFDAALEVSSFFTDFGFNVTAYWTSRSRGDSKCDGVVDGGDVHNRAKDTDCGKGNDGESNGTNSRTPYRSYKEKGFAVGLGKTHHVTVRSGPHDIKDRNSFRKGHSLGNTRHSSHDREDNVTGSGNRPSNAS